MKQVDRIRVQALNSGSGGIRYLKGFSLILVQNKWTVGAFEPVQVLGRRALQND